MDMPLPKLGLNRADLLALLNWELAAYDECAGCRFTAVKPARSKDANWTDARLEADHRLDMAEHLIARQVVRETRRVFDLV